MSSTIKREHRAVRMLIAAVLIMTCVKVWIGDTHIIPVAQAQLFDSAAQRQSLLATTERTNQLLSDIKEHLKSGVTHVRISDVENEPSATSKTQNQKTKP